MASRKPKGCVLLERYMRSIYHIVAEGYRSEQRIGRARIVSGSFKIYSRTNCSEEQYSYRRSLAHIREQNKYFPIAFRYY